MVKCNFFDLPALGRKGAALILASVFLLGHFLGVWLSGSASELFLSTMRTAVSSRVSIIGLLSSVVLPFLLSAFAVYVKQSALLIPIAFWKAFLFSYIFYGLYLAWGSAGWLVSGLMMFGSLFAMPVLYWYWLRSLDCRTFEVPVFLLVLGCLLAIGLIDYYLISPFLVEIVTF